MTKGDNDKVGFNDKGSHSKPKGGQITVDPSNHHCCSGTRPYWAHPLPSPPGKKFMGPMNLCIEQFIVPGAYPRTGVWSRGGR